eukprot:m.101327 g.101327  ORF g.101327 m.101327 type:complete len:284 (-) comp16802_c0_seq3:174-1025(-)
MEDYCEFYRRHGYCFPGKLFGDNEMDAIDSMIERLVRERPPSLAPEDLLNLHMTHEGIFQLAANKKALDVAKKLLGTQDVSIFTTRILCKPPLVGKEIPWHQDSNYWPLIPPGETEVRPQVASIWLAVDDVASDSGPMEVLGFSACPASNGRNVAAAMDTGGNTDGFDNFNITADVSACDLTQATPCLLQRGHCEAHSAWTLHRSSANTSANRRCAWIVRYVPTGTRVAGGVRGSFPADYPIVPVSGKGAVLHAPYVSSGDALAADALYAPCFGSKQNRALTV